MELERTGQADLYIQAASIATTIATKIERGLLEERDWDFLCWIAEPKVDLDAPKGE